jgi:hypothetical protein
MAITEAVEMWPTQVGKRDLLYALVDLKTNNVEYLVFSSDKKKKVLIRENMTWLPVGEEFADSSDQADLVVEQVDVNFIKYFDSLDSKGEIVPFKKKKSVTAAVGECPPATTDIALNLRNRENAIKTAAYGPLNPALPNVPFWQKKAERWSVTIDEAKQSLCANCVVFIVTDEMKQCIADGLEAGDSGMKNAWDAIDQAELGYCEAFDFKCAASRTCDAWVAGGPIDDKVKSERGTK